MKFDVYCDESYPDLLGSKKPPGRYMVIGSLWLAWADRDRFKQDLHVLRDRHRIGGEFKWTKVTPSRQGFYEELIDWFFGQGETLRFRCIVVEQAKVNLVHYHENDQELGFYKFYYQMLHHWITDFNDYSVFCDFKSNRQRDRLAVLKRCLNASNLSSRIETVQAVRSSESVLIQLVDVLTGLVSARLNERLQANGAKEKVVRQVETRLGHGIAHTRRDEKKFNVFVINLTGGW